MPDAWTIALVGMRTVVRRAPISCGVALSAIGAERSGMIGRFAMTGGAEGWGSCEGVVPVTLRASEIGVCSG